MAAGGGAGKEMLELRGGAKRCFCIAAAISHSERAEERKKKKHKWPRPWSHNGFLLRTRLGC